MASDLKKYVYSKGTDAALDKEFAGSQKFGKVFLTANTLFWKVGISRYCIPFSQISRVYRSIMPMHGKLCAGGYHFDIEYLSLVLQDGSYVQMHIGSDTKKTAENLLEAIKQAHPELLFGRPEK